MTGKNMEKSWKLTGQTFVNPENTNETVWINEVSLPRYF